MIAFQIARRFLFTSKMQTALITVGIAIGVSVQVFIGSLIQGLQNDLIDSTIGNRSQITIRSEDENEYLEDEETRHQSLVDFDSQITVVSRVLEGPGNLTTDEEEGLSAQVLLRGFNFEEAEPLYGIEDSLTEGRLPKGEDEVILGEALLEEEDLEIGDTTPLFANPPGGITRDVTVVGAFDLGTSSVNESWAILSLSTAKTFFDTEGISAYEMQISDVFESKTLAEKLRSEFSGVQVNEWQAQNQDLLSGLEGQSVSSTMIQVFVMISVVLGISSVLAITVLQKSRQLGILKAMGITDAKASLIFLFEGLILGLMGAILGVLFGLFLAFMFTQFAVNPDGTPVVALYINPTFIAVSALIAVTASVIAALIPARKSARLSVIEVIRNG
ncbi:MAG: ABC transporter permease [Bacillota bacterium]